ncbi:MAG TPA: hypothetical protein PLB45_01010 [Bacilli bacterium]|jgi:hypothetical protein|nr:hypothetical protein [Bacilli bacterium]HPZ24107.1 hypothetical protein [Bacilli bacterium]HQC83440.1 hypothetical protein [Bacilli bacterium]
MENSEPVKKYSNPWIYILLIPVGLIVIYFVFNFAYRKYQNIILDRDTKAVLTELMSHTALSTPEQYRAVAIQSFENLGYTDTDINDLSVTVNDKSIVLVSFKRYADLGALFQVFRVHWIVDGELNEGGINEALISKNTMVSSRYIATLNEYNETVISKYEGE